jgi:hypothetical protein
MAHFTGHAGKGVVKASEHGIARRLLGLASRRLGRRRSRSPAAPGRLLAGLGGRRIVLGGLGILGREADQRLAAHTADHRFGIDPGAAVGAGPPAAWQPEALRPPGTLVPAVSREQKIRHHDDAENAAAHPPQ